jgi:hypothetical protein
MPDTDPNDFTEREQFILNYYRSPQLCSPRRVLGYDLIIALASITCVSLAALREDAALGFVGYGMLLVRLYYLITEGTRWTKDFQSILAKYDAKLKALSKDNGADAA